MSKAKAFILGLPDEPQEWENTFTDATLNPLDNATRAEIASILHRFIEANK